MRLPPPILAAALVALCGVSCESVPTEVPGTIHVSELGRILEGEAPGGSQVSLQVRILGSDGDALAAPQVVTRYGQSARIEVIHEHIYPTAYAPPAVEAGSLAVTPASPTAFATEPVGTTIDLTPRVKGTLIEVRGEIRLSEFDRHVRMPGRVLQPIIAGVDGESVVISENEALMPIFRRYRTPFCILATPGETCRLEIDGPSGPSHAEITVRPLAR